MLSGGVGEQQGRKLLNLSGLSCICPRGSRLKRRDLEGVPSLVMLPHITICNPIHIPIPIPSSSHRYPKACQRRRVEGLCNSVAQKTEALIRKMGRARNRVYFVWSGKSRFVFILSSLPPQNAFRKGLRRGLMNYEPLHINWKATRLRFNTLNARLSFSGPCQWAECMLICIAAYP
jgi:hypothetical protein